MSSTTRDLVLAGVAIALAMGACIAPAPSSAPNYAICSSSANCSSETICQSVNTGNDADLCTTTCTNSANCPSDASGAEGICVQGTSGGTSFCYQACSATDTCSTGTVCTALANGGGSFCEPGTASTTCGAVAQACCTGSVCNTGLICTGGTCSTSSTACGASGQACCTTTPVCNTGLTCAGSVCSAAPTCGASGHACCANSTCNSGLTCSGGTCAATGACGAVGQTCCANSTCTGTGVVCGTNNSCGYPPYGGCPVLGATCFDGTNQSGGAVPQNCLPPQISNPGPGGFCTLMGCTTTTDCPVISGQTFGCYLIDGASSTQCFVECPTTCPAGTACENVTVDAPDGTPTGASLCMPPPA